MSKSHLPKQPYRRVCCHIGAHKPLGRNRSGTKRHPTTTTFRATSLTAVPSLDLVAAGANLYNLVDPLILWDVEVVLLRNGRRDESILRHSEVSRYSLRHSAGDEARREMPCVPPTDEMAPLEVLNQRLRSCEADKHIRLKLAPDTGSRRTIFDTPRRWSVDGGHRNGCLFKSLDDG